MPLSGLVEIPRPFDPSTQAQDGQGMLEAKISSVMPAQAGIQTYGYRFSTV